jgi:RNA polymerase sigma-70 factor (ECF subfamily)
MPTSVQASDPGHWLDLYGDYLYRYTMFRVRSTAVAEDLVQETLLAALQSRDRYHGGSQERTWLVGILKHKILDHYRRTSRNREISEGDGPTGDDYHPFDKTGDWVGHWTTDQAPRDWQLDASAILEKKEFWESFSRCLAELPEKTATAFTLREIDGLSSEEICDILNLSRSNLWVMLHRARLKLRSSLEANWFRSTPLPHESPSDPRPSRTQDIPPLAKVLQRIAATALVACKVSKAAPTNWVKRVVTDFRSFKSLQT